MINLNFNMNQYTSYIHTFRFQISTIKKKRKRREKEKERKNEWMMISRRKLFIVKMPNFPLNHMLASHAITLAFP